MAETSFNMQQFLGEYQSYNQRQYTAAENGQAAMAKREEEQAKEAIETGAFLGLTLQQKMAELGIGERVVQQLGDTAVNAITDILRPLGEWLDKYENIFDENVYNAELQSMGKQMWQANYALSEEVSKSVTGQKFVASY